MRYMLTFNSGRAEMVFFTYRQAMDVAASFSEEWFIWQTPEGKASKLIAHGFLAFGIQN